MTSTPPATAHQHDRTTNTNNSSSFRGCCCCLFLLLSFLTLLIVAAILVIVLAVKPQKPHFDLQQVGFQYMGISPVTTTQSAAAVSLIIHMFFVATNDNKVGIKYNEFWFTVMYHGIPLGRGAVPEFYQPAHNVRLVETTIVVDRVNLIQANAAYMLGEASLNDRVALRVLGDSGAGIRGLYHSLQSNKADPDEQTVWIRWPKSVTNCIFTYNFSLIYFLLYHTLKKTFDRWIIWYKFLSYN